MKAICWIKGLYRSLITGLPVNGHSFVEIHRSYDSQTLKCERCGEISGGFF